MAMIKRIVFRPLLVRLFSNDTNVTSLHVPIIPKENVKEIKTHSLNLSQRAFLAVGSSVLAFMNPWRGDLVAVLGEVTGQEFLPGLKKQLESSEEGRELMKKKFRVNKETVPLDKLALLPKNTFGYQYSQFMISQKFLQEGRATVRFIDDIELAYVMQRYRESHDYWHVLTELDTSVLGEITGKWLEMLQTGLPSTALSSLVGPLSLSLSQKVLLVRSYIPWVISCNKGLKQPLMSIYYENYFERDIDELRELWGITVSPKL